MQRASTGAIYSTLDGGARAPPAPSQGQPRMAARSLRFFFVGFW